MALRALIVTRLSKATEASTSDQTQLSLCRDLCEKRGYQEVGHAKDLGVSAGISPFKRPELGPWLERPQDFDVLVVARVDRLVRRLPDLAKVVEWAETHDVKLVSATEPHFDLTLPFGNVIATLIATVAEMELDSIRERTGRASKFTIESGRWRGGVPPWGYRPVKCGEGEEDEGHWKLVQDPDQVAVIREVVDRVLGDDEREGESLRSIAHDLTGRKIMTPKDAFAAHRGREVKGYEWHSGPLRRSLSSPTMLGQMTRREPLVDDKGEFIRKNGKRVLGPETVLRGPDGAKLQRADPILEPAEFKRLVRVLESRENKKEKGRRTHGLLRQVIFCGVCGRPGYRLEGGPGRKPRYRCASAQYKDQCANKSIVMADAEKQVEKEILERLGPMERMRRVWQPGNDVTAELAEVDDELEDLAGQVGQGLFKAGTPGRARLEERVALLGERREELAAQPVEPARWTYVGTGETIAQWWSGADDAEKNAWMRQHGIRATWTARGERNGKRPVIVADDLTVELGSPDLGAEVLPGVVAEYAELGQRHDPSIRGALDAMAAGFWRDGDALAEMVAADKAEQERGSE